MSNRIPIYLNSNTVALITIYTRTDHIEDIWITDYPEYDKNPDTISKEAAKQFMDQLEDRWTPRFLKALKNEIEERLHDECSTFYEMDI